MAAQCLPDVERVEARSISQWAAKAGEWSIGRLHEHAGPWRLHVFCVPTAEGSVTFSRCAYIEEAIAERLRKRQRRLLRTWNREQEPPLKPDEWLLQVALRTATAGYLSAVAPGDWRHWRRSVSRFPGGVVAVPSDHHAPSRAFAKVAEVEMRLARPIMPGETCVDLGSSPGSWAYWALQRGATVVAVDRSSLRADLMRHTKLTFVRGDAFRYRPPQPVDWLLCDVIAFPAKTIALVKQWLDEGWCRHFCATVKFRGGKFRGGADYDKLEPLKAWLSAAGHNFYLRRLAANKNEVTLFGQAASTCAELPGGL